MSSSYEVNTFSQTFTAAAVEGGTNYTGDERDAHPWSGASTESPDTTDNEPNTLVAHRTSVPLDKKPSFSCTHEPCPKAFTTKYRLKTHVNRFHTARERQERHQCENCSYSTCYKTDLLRHQKNVHAQPTHVRLVCSRLPRTTI
ncbi:hypothetical protein HYPSUDRAFT_49887 [Hypholoma sublateritium FD-334 SS-4]|uniref:C2H2-type domain-containing protein n=1 Tax=Hypholoma sublateritium (strain FD-334 SS-4) TaxID=945553 RepID=A0A0D2NY09_HYPSF|nr:hypothetical protein HYPSUDRAFT_49887 [Hypholoma sublateritium FD-334 SS-4]